MTIRRAFLAFLLFAAPALSNCGSSTTAATTVATTPTSTATVTESFTGSLNKNGGSTYAFLANGAGTVSALIKSVAPDATVAIGVSIGSWTGSACLWAVANDNAQQGTAVTGTTTGSANLCVRVYDVGKIGDTPVTFAIDITHP